MTSGDSQHLRLQCEPKYEYHNLTGRVASEPTPLQDEKSEAMLPAREAAERWSKTCSAALHEQSNATWEHESKFGDMSWLVLGQQRVARPSCRMFGGCSMGGVSSAGRAIEETT